MPDIDALFYLPAASVAAVVAGRFCLHGFARCGALMRGFGHDAAARRA